MLFGVTALLASVAASAAATNGVETAVLPGYGTSWRLAGGARAYFESAYISSTGSFGYTRPVAEQYYDLSLLTADYGKLRVDMWCISDLTGQQLDVHQREFFCWEGTAMYGCELPLDTERRFVVDTDAGILWDWLNGYRAGNGTPLCWYAFQSLRNPYLIPYWNALGAFYKAGPWTRIRLGLQHDWRPFRSLSLSPFIDTTWGSPNRFLSNYGDDVGDSILGGSVMFGTVGVIGRWYFTKEFYLWTRFKEMVVLDPRARRLMDDRPGQTARTEYAFFGVGLGFRF